MLVKGIFSSFVISFIVLAFSFIFLGKLSLFESHKVVDNIENKIKLMDSRYEYITIHVNPS